jgi:hypothetical protein
MHLTAWSSDEFDCAEAFLDAFPILLAKAIAQVAARRHRHKGTQAGQLAKSNPQASHVGEKKRGKCYILVCVQIC